MMLRSILLFFPLIFGVANLSRADGPERIPVVVKIDPAVLAGMPADQRAAVEMAAEAIRDQMTTWSRNYKPGVPSSSFPAGAELIQVGEFFQTPTTNKELAAIGAGRQLTAEEIGQLKGNGQFVIPSPDWSGKNNVFEVHWLVQNGRNNIEISLQKGTELSSYLWAVSFSDRWVSPDPLSYRHALKNFFGGIGRALSSVVGLPTMKRAVSDYEILERLQKEASEATRQSLQAESGTTLDWTLYDAKMQEKVAPALEAFMKTFAKQWEADEPAEIASILTDMGEGADETISLARLKAVRDAAFEKAMLDDAGLKAVGAQVPQLLVNRFRAKKIIDAAQERFQLALNKHRGHVASLLKSKHKIRSKSESWLNKNVEKDMLANFDQIWSESFAVVPGELRAAGLDQEAALYEATWNYYQGEPALAEVAESAEVATVGGLALENSNEGEGLALRRELEAARVPSRTFVMPSYRWSSANWVISNIAPAGQPTYHVAQTAKEVKVSTRLPLWRVWLAGARVRTYFNNVARFFWVEGFRRGFGIPGMGWDSLVARNGEQVTLSESLIPESGTVYTEKKHSLSSLRAAWKQLIIAANARDLPKGKTSLLGEVWHARLTWVKNNFMKGAVSNVVIPLLALPNLALCAANAVATCVLPAPLALVTPPLEYLWTQLVWDHDHPRGAGTASLSPVIKNLLIDTTLLGGGELVLNTIGFVGGAVGSPAIWLGTRARYWVNTKWDNMIRGLAERNYLKLYVPGEDSWLSRRIEGPGLAANYSYQVKPEVLVVGVQALLESFERSYFESTEKARLLEPLSFHDGVASALFGVGNSFLRNSVAGPVNDHLKTLEAALAAADKAAPKIAPKGQIHDSVRLNKADLEKALVDALPVVRKFYEDRLVAALGGNTEKFWKERELETGDFLGLTRALISNIFGNNILTPLEEADESFRIVASDAPGIGDVVGNILSATSSLDWDVAPIQQVQAWEAPAARRRQVSVGGDVARVQDLLSPCERVVITSHMRDLRSI